MAVKSYSRPTSRLEEIVHRCRERLAETKRSLPLAKLEERAATAPPVRDLRAALARDALNVIAELKQASPSRGLLRRGYNPAALAPALEQAGAVAFSVLTEKEFFRGSLEDLTVVRQLTPLPVLRKDFLFDPYQVFEARAAGADAFLLIAAVLSTTEVRQLIRLGEQLGMAALVEVHTREELDCALEAGTRLVGVNNRDLKTFAVELETSARLIEAIPDDRIAVSESGLKTAADLARLRALGFDAFLVGEHLMQAADPAAALAQLLSGA
ncbi:MAG: indole-3-glycerol phosphate synthase TrpC [Acidobacteria bacterium]|nr:indole-3-glycerol phosphate synthase TrpC [Acidobacteriota bacterium]